MIRNFVIFWLFISTLFYGLTSFAADAFEINLYIKDHKFSPEILEVPSGKKIRITIYNQDSTIEEFESVELKREKIILGNSKAIVVLAPLKPGAYNFFGEFHEDTAQGKIIVKEEIAEIKEDV